MGSPSLLHHLWLPSTPRIEHPTRTGCGLPFMHFLDAWSHLYCPQPAVRTHLSLSPCFLGNMFFPFKEKQVCWGPEWTSGSVQTWPEHPLESQSHCVSLG